MRRSMQPFEPLCPLYSMCKNFLHGVASFALLCLPHSVMAQDASSPNMLGALGLNTTPSARMDKAGTVRAGISTLDPYLHGFIGIQLAKPLSITLRQSALTSGLNDDPDALFPSVDFKIRLVTETAHRPELSLGLQSAIGHKRMAGEYLVASKRYKNFDFSAGMGWGRYANTNTLSNPLRKLHRHFSNDRDPDSEMPNEVRDWFSGKSIGFFGGVEYFLPYDGLSLKLDYGSDDYSAEHDALNGKTQPWGLGLAYTKNWGGGNIGIQGSDKIMARLHVQTRMDLWPFHTGKHFPTDRPFYKQRPYSLNIPAISEHAAQDRIALQDIQQKKLDLSAILQLSPDKLSPAQIGRSMRIMAQSAGKDIETLSITPTMMNLRGTQITLMRSDLEKALNGHRSSPPEIWKNAVFSSRESRSPSFRSSLKQSDLAYYSLVLDHQFSLSEEDSGTLHRTGLIAGYTQPKFLGFLTYGTSFRLNLEDNLKRIAEIRPPSPVPVRSDIADFSENALALQTSYVGFTHSFTPEIHMSLLGGYLEEMYAGAGGEILYRPFGSRLALGAQLWQVVKRDSQSPLHAGLTEATTMTGQIEGWYDIPAYDATLNVRAGRFLAGDVGIGIGLEKSFGNGAKLSGETVMSNYSDPDLFGGYTHAYHRLSLSLPLGSFKYLPEGTRLDVTAAPFGRDTAQSLSPPIRLYDLTESLTLPHLAQHWATILDK